MTAPRILIVEDERIPAFNLQQGLKKLGYDVPAVAASGAEALRLIDEQAPDIVLMDIHIEGPIDGIETARRIPAELMIPVIYLTAYSEEATLQRATATKPHGYLLKPFSDRELHATIQMVLQRHEVELALRRSEAELRRSREDFRYLFKNSPLPKWVFDIETAKFLDVNDAAIATYGFSRDEFLAMTIFDIRAPEDAAKAARFLEADLPEYMEVRNWRHMRKDGEPIQVDGFSHALEFDGRPARIVVVIDVTQRNIAEEQLRQAQKMEAIGQLTGGVAHDFNNLLAIIQGNLELLSEKIPPDPPISNFVAAALRAAERGAILTQRLLAYSRQQPLESQVVTVEILVANVVILMRRTLGAAIDVKVSIAPDCSRVRIDPNQLENALLNLAVNARDAMPEGGCLTIEANNAILDPDYAAENVEVVPGAYVMLAVSDNGTGMAPDVVRRAFEPFFTTKPVGRGTGLGLSMVFGFVKQSGGHIKIYSEMGRGTSVKLYLPRADQEAPSQDAEIRAHTPISGKGENIMVVEDDPALRQVIVTLLTDLGYHTADAEDGMVALDMIDGGRHFDLVLTDVVLPNGISGPTLAATATKALPSLKVLYMSGYTRDAMQHNRVLGEGASLMMKPFRKRDLAQKIRELLDAGA
jgi:PAS domain S-box-containing protein